MSPFFVVMLALQPAPMRTVTLANALESGRNRPLNMQAQLSVDVARAQVGEALSPLLPQVQGTASWQRSTSNYIARPSQLPTGVAVTQTSSTATGNFWQFGLTVNQLLYDSQVSIDRLRSFQANAAASQAGLHVAELATDLEIRTAYYAALATKALVKVAEEAYANEDKHLQQVEGFVKVGTHPEIDLAQERTMLANDKVALVQARGNFETARAQLNMSMGLLEFTDYDVVTEPLVPIPNEDDGLDGLTKEAEKMRPDILKLDKQIRAQELIVSSTKGNYGPSIATSMGLTYAGRDISNLAWNWNAQIGATWNLFTGLSTWNSVKEQQANLKIVRSNRDQLRLQVQLDVSRAVVAVRTNKEALRGADEALVNAKERLRLAEGRYAAGVGSIIEQGDAQLALTQAAAQRVQAEYNLETARAQLVYALGRNE